MRPSQYKGFLSIPSGSSPPPAIEVFSTKEETTHTTTIQQQQQQQSNNNWRGRSTSLLPQELSLSGRSNIVRPVSTCYPDKNENSTLPSPTSNTPSPSSSSSTSSKFRLFFLRSRSKSDAPPQANKSSIKDVGKMMKKNSHGDGGVGGGGGGEIWICSNCKELSTSSPSSSTSSSQSHRDKSVNAIHYPTNITTATTTLCLHCRQNRMHLTTAGKTTQTSGMGTSQSIFSRFRSLSTSANHNNSRSDSSSNSGRMTATISTGPPSDPTKLPKTNATSSLAFTNSNLKRVKEDRHKFGQTSSLSRSLNVSRSRSVNTDSGNLQEVSSSLAKSEENFFASIHESLDSHRLMRALEQNSPHKASSITCIFENSRYAFLSKAKRRESSGELEEALKMLDEKKIFAAYFKHCSVYDVLPDSGKLIIIDSQLEIWRAYRAMTFNGVRAVPIWDSEKQDFTGILSFGDFVLILHFVYSMAVEQEEARELRTKTVAYWKAKLNQGKEEVISFVEAETDLLTCVRVLRNANDNLVCIQDSNKGNLLGLLNYKRVFRYLHVKRRRLEFVSHNIPHWLSTSIESSGLCSTDIVFVPPTTPLVDVLQILKENKFQSVPIVDEENNNCLVNIFTKFDTATLVFDESYMDRSQTVMNALESRKRRFIGLVTCLLCDSILSLMDKFCQYEVKSIVVIDNEFTQVPIGFVHVNELLEYLLCEKNTSN